MTKGSLNEPFLSYKIFGAGKANNRYTVLLSLPIVSASLYIPPSGRKVYTLKPHM